MVCVLKVRMEKAKLNKYKYILISFSSCQRNMIKTFQIDGMIALITKMDLIFFHETC